MVYKLFDKKSKRSGVINNNNNNNNKNIQLVKELQKPIIKNFQKRTFYSRIKNNI